MTSGTIVENVALHRDTDQNIDPAALGEVFAGPETTVWSGGSVVANEPWPSRFQPHATQFRRRHVQIV